MVVGLPRADGGSHDDGVFVGRHGVLYIGQNEQEAANGGMRRSLRASWTKRGPRDLVCSSIG